MSEICDVCGQELASVETRNLLHSGELVRYGEYRGKCIKDVSCIQRGYEREKARAEKADAKAAQYERDWYAAKSEFGTAMAKSREALAAARRETDLHKTALSDLLKLIDEGVLVRNIGQDGEPGWTLKAMRLVMALKHAYALAAPAAGEEGT